MRRNLSEWFKSSYSGQNGDCVEARNHPGGHIGIRDSKTQDGPVLAFTAEARLSFLAAVRRGEFDAGEGSSAP